MCLAGKLARRLVATRESCYNQVTMKDRIAINPNVCHGKPVIRGTRVLVSTILGALAGGDTIDVVLENYPNIKREDVQAALEFAGRLSQFKEVPYGS